MKKSTVILLIVASILLIGAQADVEDTNHIAADEDMPIYIGG